MSDRGRVGFVAGLPVGLCLARKVFRLQWRNRPRSAMPRAMASTLVIVESPAKASTIQKILPSETYDVRSCVGHIRELPSSAKRIPAKYKDKLWSRLGVDIENGFQPLYVLIAGKQKVITELKNALQNSDELILATDEDREGEAISWHLVEVLKPKVPIRRAVFHEITPEAIKHGIATGRDIDLKLVEAQETRRILDRLAGYTMSPLLWKKISRGLSAGRVQSVALAAIVSRELERLRFVSASYFDAVGIFSSSAGSVTATLVSFDRKRIAHGSDFVPESGKLTEEAKRKGTLVLGENDVLQLLDNIKSSIVTSVQKSRVRKKPPLPFITSTLQQECGNKLGMNAGRVMRVAQRLYENGNITYMRTDNPALSEQAIKASREAVKTRYGAEYLRKAGDKTNVVLSKSAQAAHEAIRPAGVSFCSPESIPLDDSDEIAMYTLIYRRTLASQMAVAEYDTTSITIDAETATSAAAIMQNAGAETRVATFRAGGRVMVFPGFLRAYEEHQEVIGDEHTMEQNCDLPDVRKGDSLMFQSGEPTSHKTMPRPRYTDASLVKELEERGVGRPSTYASIIEKLVDRMYVFRGKDLREERAGVSSRALVPSLTAFAVNRLLSSYFPAFVDAEFTAQMEEALDTIASGGADGTSYLTAYYLGNDGLAATVEQTEKFIDDFAFRKIALPGMPKQMQSENVNISDSTRQTKPSVPTETKPKKHKSSESLQDLDVNKIDWNDLNVLVGPHGPYLEYRSNVVASLPRTILAEELTEARLKNILELAKDPVLGIDPASGVPILVKTSKFGPYVQYGRDDADPSGEKPRRQSLLPGMDVNDLNLDLALQLLSLPRLLGQHPETGNDVRAAMGPFGPYIVHEGIQPAYANLKKGDYDLFSINLQDALELLAQVQQRRERREASMASKNPVESRRNKSKGKQLDAVDDSQCRSVSESRSNVKRAATSGKSQSSSPQAHSSESAGKQDTSKRRGRKSASSAKDS